MEMQKTDNPEVTLLHATERVDEAVLIGAIEYIRQWCTAIVDQVPARDIKKTKVVFKEREKERERKEETRKKNRKKEKERKKERKKEKEKKRRKEEEEF